MHICYFVYCDARFAGKKIKKGGGCKKKIVARELKNSQLHLLTRKEGWGIFGIKESNG